jgi:hypothetical protein
VEALGLAASPRVVGLQFDNHVGMADIERWLQFDAAWALTGSGADAPSVLAAARTQEGEMGRSFRHFMSNFLQLTVGQ